MRSTWKLWKEKLQAFVNLCWHHPVSFLVKGTKCILQICYYTSLKVSHSDICWIFRSSSIFIHKQDSVFGIAFYSLAFSKSWAILSNLELENKLIRNRHQQKITILKTNLRPIRNLTNQNNNLITGTGSCFVISPHTVSASPQLRKSFTPCIATFTSGYIPTLVRMYNVCVTKPELQRVRLWGRL